MQPFQQRTFPTLTHFSFQARIAHGVHLMLKAISKPCLTRHAAYFIYKAKPCWRLVFSYYQVLCHVQTRKSHWNWHLYRVFVTAEFSADIRSVSIISVFSCWDNPRFRHTGMTKQKKQDKEEKHEGLICHW